MKQQLVSMLELQDAMNTKVQPGWREQGRPWYRAIWIECAELMDHYGWKWWKKQTPERDQVVLELVDIWHFGLSIVLMRHSDVATAAEHIESAFDFSPRETSFRDDVELFAQNTLVTRDFDITNFSHLMTGADLSFDELYKRYVGKNVLNFFRQDHGYKDGRYIKNWQGREDNVHLVEILEQLDPELPDFSAELYRALELRYIDA